MSDTFKLHKWAYSPTLVEKVCELITTGHSLTEILDGKDLPTYLEFCRWRRQYPYINEMLEKAREDRTEWLRDRLIQLADTVDEDNVQSTKTKIDIYKHLMATENKKQYGQTKVEVGIAQPVQIIVQTGIDRAPIKEVAEAHNTGSIKQLGEIDVQTKDVESEADYSGER